MTRRELISSYQAAAVTPRTGIATTTTRGFPESRSRARRDRESRCLRRLAHDGVRAVITADDVKAAGFKSLPNTVNYPGKDGQQIRKPFYPVLATGRVRHVGEAIAMVVADTAEIAEDARESIAIEHRDFAGCQHVRRRRAARRAPTARRHPRKSRIRVRLRRCTGGRAAFGRAKYVSRLTVDSQRVVGNALEPRAGLVQYDAATDRYHCHIPLQGVGGMKGQITVVTGLNKDKIVSSRRTSAGVSVCAARSIPNTSR